MLLFKPPWDLRSLATNLNKYSRLVLFSIVNLLILEIFCINKRSYKALFCFKNDGHEMGAKFHSLIQNIKSQDSSQAKNLFDKLKLTIQMSSDLLSLFDFLNKKGYQTGSNKCLKYFEAFGVKLCNLIHLLELVFNETFVGNLVRF